MVIRGGILRVGAYASGVLLSLVAAALLIRHLGPKDFGRYTTVLSLVTVAGGLTEAGMTNLGVREWSIVGRELRGPLVRNLLGLRLLLAATGALAAIAFASLAGYDRAMVAGTALAGIGLVLTTAQATYGVPLQASLRLGWISLLDVLRQAVTVVLVGALVALGASLLPLIAVLPVAGVVVLAATIWLVRGWVPLRPGFDRAQAVRFLRLAVPYAAASAVGVVYVYLAVVLMSLVSTQEETGYFGAAFRVFVVLGGFPGLLIASAFPVLSRAASRDEARLAYALQGLWEISIVVGAGLALATAIGAGVAIDVVAGSAFEPSVDVLRVQAGAVLASYLVATWGFALLSLDSYGGLLVANGLTLALSAGLTLSLAPSHGAVGAAVATLAGESVLAVAYGAVLFLRRPELRPSLEVVPRVALACGLAALIVLVPGLPEIVELAGACAIYLAAVVVLRAVPEEVGKALAPWVPRRRG